MGNIVILDEITSNKIAAGEVIERPSSVVKELVENSIDAGATKVTIEIKKGGISYIKVTDNGSGIKKDDIEIAFERHATSKIRKADDLEQISTMGFRGEALASISSVSKIEVYSKEKESEYGSYAIISGGNLIDSGKKGCSVGTTFIVKDLFYNTPARYKFLKKDTTEASNISDIITKLAIGNPEIAFKYINNGKNVLNTPGNNDLMSVLFSIYGKGITKDLVKTSFVDKRVKIYGFIGKPELSRSNRNFQILFINKRFIKNKLFYTAIEQSYKTYIMKNRYPVVFLNMELSPSMYDVNVHPSKLEVRFENENEIFKSIYYSVKNALEETDLTKDIKMEKYKKDIIGTVKDLNIVLERDNKDIDINCEKSNKGMENIKYDNNERIFRKKEEGNIQFNICNYNEGEEDKKMENSTLKEKEIRNNVLNEKKEQYSIENLVNNIEYNKERKEDCDKNKILKGKVIGQVLKTYIIIEIDSGIYLLDQHAAHERVRFEKLLEMYKESNINKQILISSIVINLSDEEYNYAKEKLNVFEKIGFEIDEFGKNSVLLRTVPIDCFDNPKEIFLEILEMMMNYVDDFFKYYEKILYTIACKGSIKANKTLSNMEIETLIKDLMKLKNPFTCPHGRPVIIKISVKEIEKMFKRIV